MPKICGRDLLPQVAYADAKRGYRSGGMCLTDWPGSRSSVRWLVRRVEFGQQVGDLVLVQQDAADVILGLAVRWLQVLVLS